MSARLRILHATDFDPAGEAAFAHALRIAIEGKARLYILHVVRDGAAEAWSQFPHVRELLAGWGLMDPRNPPQAIERRLGVHVEKISIRSPDVRQSIARFAREHECDLLVLGTHGRAGAGLFGAGLIDDLSVRVHARTLFIPIDASGFVDPRTGHMNIDSVLIPVDDEFSPAVALRRIQATLQLIAPRARLHFLHVGRKLPALRDEAGAPFELPIVLRQGDVTQAISSFARECGARLVAMPTAGRQGVFDALRGSTTERVLYEAKLPVLAAPT